MDHIHLLMPTKQNNKRTFANFQLITGYWLATHRVLTRKIYTALCVFFALTMVLAALYQLINWLGHIRQTNEIWSNFAPSIVNFRAVGYPQNIQFPRVQAVRRDDYSVDVLIQMKNSNTKWAALEVTYEVSIDQKKLGAKTVALAPLQENYQTEMQIPHVGANNPTASVQIINTTWKRISQTSSLPDVEWESSDAEFRYIRSTEKESPYQSEITFTLRNKSVYGFRGAEVVVVMEDSDNSIQGIGSVVIDEIKSLETRTLTFRWPQRLNSATQPNVHVNIDKLAEDRIIRRW